MSTPSNENTIVNNICHVLVAVDGRTEEPIDVIELTRFELIAFCKQFDVPVEHDPEMLDRYVVGPDDEGFLRNYLDVPFTFDFSSTGYWIEAATK